VQPELSLQGLNGFSHIWVIFLFHKAQHKNYRPKVQPPRLEGGRVGVFASRSPHRPNPIGLSLLELVEVNRSGVWVKGVDLIDGTPVLDIKPYLPEVESQPHAQRGWLEELSWKPLRVEWTSSSEVQVSVEAKRLNCLRLKELIENTLAQEPRPQVYRQADQRAQPYKEKYAFELYDLDVVFVSKSPGALLVVEVKQKSL
jgi:tRNA-Thr(GGU) m(6)t(6)A37 methyltransferase TsaA